MRRGNLIVALCALVVASTPAAATWTGQDIADLIHLWHIGTPFPSIQPSHRYLVIAPHPDDEALACGGLIQRAVERRAPLAVVILTNGDTFRFACERFARTARPTRLTYTRFGEQRARESERVLRWLKVKPEDIYLLGYPDEGLKAMEWNNWLPDHAYRSPATHDDRCPYRIAWHPGRNYNGEALETDLRTIIQRFRPTDILLPHPADRNPDHAAASWFVQRALAGTALAGRVRLHGYLVHWPRWPRRISHLGLYDSLLPPARVSAGAGRWEVLTLSPAEIARKALAIDHYHTETEMRGYRPFLLSFARRNELFAPLNVPQRGPGFEAPRRAAYRGRSALSAALARG